jgi:hypothetical protein
MKKVLLIILILISMQAFAQTDGLTYQAIIIGPDTQELPGVDAQNNILPNARVAIRFTIIDANNSVEYQEVQTTNTDQYGRINLLIGAADHDAFTKIKWDGTNKDLKVEIDFTGGVDFVDMSREQLTFLPFAFHRNIQATGTLTVDDKAYLNSELTVQGPTRLNSTLDVNNNNETNLSGVLNVEGTTYLKDSLSVLNQKNTFLSGDLTVEGKSEFADIETEYLIVEKTSNLKGQVTINADDIANGPGNGDQVYTSSYPLIVQGGTQGIVVMVKGNANQTPNNSNNFIQFRDNRNIIWGRIEGEIESELNKNWEYKFELQSLENDITSADVDYLFQSIDVAIAATELAGATADIRPCVGFGACVTSPGPAQIAAASASLIYELSKEVFVVLEMIRVGNQRNDYLDKTEEYVGVTYQSGAGDYAEYLLRADISETINFGDIVGVKGGKISKSTEGAERMMVISRKPIVLGNMPQPNREHEYEKVAFMGQVPVKVYGKVNIGDYIIPSGKNDGIGIAIEPSKIKIKDIKKIVGVAWTAVDNIFGFNMVNVAVGLNANDNNPMIEKLEMKVQEQAIEITNLKDQLESLISRVLMIEQGISNSAIIKSTNQQEIAKKGEVNGRKYEIEEIPDGEVIYWEIKREDLEKGLKMAEEQMRENGIDMENNPFWKQIKTDPNFKTQLFDKIEKKLEKQFHYHKVLNKE